MDAVEFLKTKSRLCHAYVKDSCCGCPLRRAENYCALWCFVNPEEAVDAAERWAKQHPVKTRQSEFLKQWPDAERYCSGALSVCPKSVDRNLKLDCSRPCDKCCSQFWLEEIE
jgi:hypothetical protein